MRKIYSMENLDCANCAAKIEDKFNALPQVQEAVITFATRQLRLTAEDPDALIPELTALARTVEGEVVIRPREQAGPETGERHHECSCGHHDREHSCGCGHHHAHGHSCGGHDHSCTCGHETHDEADKILKAQSNSEVKQ